MTRYNFDKPIERRGTASAKWDRHAKAGKSPDLLPLWVADMDFRIPDEAIDALQERATHGVFGYTDPNESYFEAVSSWFERNHGWKLDGSECLVTPGVCFALAQIVRAFTQPGDAVLIQPPVYYPFRAIIEENGRVPVKAPLIYDADVARAGAQAAATAAGAQAVTKAQGGAGAHGEAETQAATGTQATPEARIPHPYSIDFDAFERAIAESNAKLFILCNPHNPVGRVWTPEELQRMGDICAAHHVLVVSDEIHADFARPGFTHTPFATLGDAYANNCIVCTAPSKTFNLAGLQVSNIVVPNADLRTRLADEIEATGFGNINSMGMVAAEACYRFGQDWLDELKVYLEGNLAAMNDFLARELPEVTLIQPESTYLTWVDCSGLGLSHQELREAIEGKARLWLDHGAMFGPEGIGFMRFNNATQRATLMQALEQFASIRPC